ncbi:MAG: DUF3431 domain-containing protein [bacterium]
MKKIQKNFLVISNFNNDLSWVPEYTDNYVIYNKRSDKVAIPETIDFQKVLPGSNNGYNSYEYFTYIIDNYDNLPDCIIFAKGWSFPRHVRKETFDKVMNNTWYTPLEDWKTYDTIFPVAYLSPDGGLCEINSSWYFKYWKHKYFHNHNDFIRFLYKDPVIPLYVRFSPGGDFIAPKERILKVPKVVYQNLRLFMSHCQEPAETHMIERTMFTLMMSNFEFNPKILVPLDEDFINTETKPEPISRKLYFLFASILANILYKKIFMNTKILIQKIYRKIKNILLIKKNALLSKTYKNPSKKKIAEIANYRKTIKIYDIFNFFNELELLDIRLNILDPYVDYFVIVESTLTHSGKPKELFYEKNKERFKQFEHKIIHYVIEHPLQDFTDAQERLNEGSISQLEKTILKQTLTSDNIPKGMNHFLRDFYEKESVKHALTNLSDNDFCFVSDLDEIWNPEIVIDYQKDDIYKFRQAVYCYYLNNKSNEAWTGTLATKYKNIKNNCLNHLRTKRKTPYTFVNNGGWHFTYQGGENRVKEKIESFSHQELNNDSTKNQITERLQNNQDVAGRNFAYHIDEKGLPRYIKENKDKYKELFK